MSKGEDKKEISRSGSQCHTDTRRFTSHLSLCDLCGDNKCPADKSFRALGKYVLSLCFRDLREHQLEDRTGFTHLSIELLILVRVAGMLEQMPLHERLGTSWTGQSITGPHTHCCERTEMM